MNAIDYHSYIAKSFGDRYLLSADFKERFDLWTSLIDSFTSPGHKVLDAGCGTGIFSYYAAKKGCFVTAIDGSSEMIRLCNQYSRFSNNIQFYEMVLPLQSDKITELFDLIISSSVLEYIPELNETYTCFSERLKVGGYLIVSLPNRQSFYRKLEKFSYLLFKKPNYLAHLYHYGTLSDISNQLSSNGYTLITGMTYGGKNIYAQILRLILPAKYVDTLCLAVLRKI